MKLKEKFSGCETLHVREIKVSRILSQKCFQQKTLYLMPFHESNQQLKRFTLNVQTNRYLERKSYFFHNIYFGKSIKTFLFYDPISSLSKFNRLEIVLFIMNKVLLLIMIFK